MISERAARVWFRAPYGTPAANARAATVEQVVCDLCPDLRGRISGFVSPPRPVAVNHAAGGPSEFGVDPAPAPRRKVWGKPNPDRPSTKQLDRGTNVLLTYHFPEPKPEPDPVVGGRPIIDLETLAGARRAGEKPRTKQPFKRPKYRIPKMMLTYYGAPFAPTRLLKLKDPTDDVVRRWLVGRGWSDEMAETIFRGGRPTGSHDERRLAWGLRFGDLLNLGASAAAIARVTGSGARAIRALARDAAEPDLYSWEQVQSLCFAKVLIDAEDAGRLNIADMREARERRRRGVQNPAIQRAA